MIGPPTKRMKAPDSRRMDKLTEPQATRLKALSNRNPTTAAGPEGYGCVSEHYDRFHCQKPSGPNSSELTAAATASEKGNPRGLPLKLEVFSSFDQALDEMSFLMEPNPRIAIPKVTKVAPPSGTRPAPPVVGSRTAHSSNPASDS